MWNAEQNLPSTECMCGMLQLEYAWCKNYSINLAWGWRMEWTWAEWNRQMSQLHCSTALPLALPPHTLPDAVGEACSLR